MIFRNVRLPGDFAMIDVDGDGDLDWVGTSLTLGQAFIIEQIRPDTGLVANLSVPADFDGQVTQLVLTLAEELPVTGMPAAILATIDNGDVDENGLGDVDEILNASRDLTLALEDVGIAGAYHVVAVLYMEGGGVFQPVPGVDYMAASGPMAFGQGVAEVTLELELLQPVQPAAPAQPETQPGRDNPRRGWVTGR